MNDRWNKQYTPKSYVDKHWYDSVMAPIDEVEWMNTINSLPNGKASGVSKVSNEFLKHMGPEMRTATRKLCNLCLILNDIPGEWREGVIYPIPKPTEWNCNLANTRPITLLETLRKAFVKVITNRLTSIIANRNILREVIMLLYQVVLLSHRYELLTLFWKMQLILIKKFGFCSKTYRKRMTG